MCIRDRGHASSAAGSASAAASSATAADGHADRAEAAANEFDLTATSSTLAPGAAATVTVSGDGPAYQVAFGIPQGDKGDKGEVSQAQLDAALAGKAATSHTHPVTDLTATGTRSSSTYLRGDGSWATPPNNIYSVPTQAEAEAGTATTARAFTAQRVRQAADAAITAREWFGTQAQYDALPTKDPNRTYNILEG